MISDEEEVLMREQGKFPDGMTEFAELMINDDENIKKKTSGEWWGFFGKDTILTRSDDEDRWEAMNDFAISKNNRLMSRPYYKADINDLRDTDQVRRRFITQHRRSLAGFERQALMTQIKELRTNRPLPGESLGFFGSLKQKLGFGPKPAASVAPQQMTGPGG